VHFQDSPTGGGSIAIMYADNENGVVLPGGFTLSTNAVGILEIQTGTGNDATDFTNYTPFANRSVRRGYGGSNDCPPIDYRNHYSASRAKAW